MSDVATAQPELSDDAQRLRILDAIRELARPFTLADIVTRTGIPPYLAEPALAKVVREYRSDLDVDESGNLVYRFDPGLAAREDIVKADAGRRRKEALRRGFIAFFKAWTVAMVIIYFILYITLVIAFFVALSANSRRDNDSRGRSWGGGGFGWGWSSWGWGGGYGYGGYGSYTTRRDRRAWNTQAERKLAAGEDPYALADSVAADKPKLAERTWYHLFGTRGIQRNPLAEEKELLTYIRAKKGFITNADIIALLGVTYDVADQIGTRLVATYEGEMDLTDEGLAIYRFPNLMLTGAPEVQAETASLGYLWKLRAKEHALRTSPVTWLAILNYVNIALAFVTWFVIMPFFGWSGIGALIGLVFFPLLFSFSFMTLGLVRKAREAAAAAQYNADSLRISVFRLVFGRKTSVRMPGDERAIAAAGLGNWTTEQLQKAAPTLAEALRGEIRQAGGGLELRCDRVLAEMATVEKLRRAARSQEKVGRTVFTTREMAGASAIGDVPEAGARAEAGSDAALAEEIKQLEKELQSS